MKSSLQESTALLTERLARQDADLTASERALAEALGRGKLDLAWLGGFSYVQARQLGEVRPIAQREEDPNHTSVFIVHEDSHAHQLKDLRGKSFAFGAQTSAAGHLMPRWFLQRDGLRPETQGWTDQQIMTALGVPNLPAEGQFFPDTYAYAKGSTDLAVMRRAQRAMHRHLTEAWAQRAAASPLKSPQDALILASIVEKETGHGEDRGLVSGVFNNRLRIGMPLQTDPTVIYGLGDAFDGNLRKVHLQTDGPFNTYQRGGLPPTPIAMPGKAALLAAVRPDATRALYFVASGDGRSVFSETLADHNRAVNRYQRKRP